MSLYEQKFDEGKTVLERMWGEGSFVSCRMAIVQQYSEYLGMNVVTMMLGGSFVPLKE